MTYTAASHQGDDPDEMASLLWSCLIVRQSMRTQIKALFTQRSLYFPARKTPSPHSRYASSH